MRHHHDKVSCPRIRTLSGPRSRHYSSELSKRVERLEKARDALRAQNAMVAPDVSANELADILDAELCQLLDRLRELA